MPPQSSVSPEESREAFDARLAGAQREIVDELGFSVEGARKLVDREAQRQIAELEAVLRLDGAVELEIPSGDRLERALARARWAAGQLTLRGVDVCPYVISRGGGIAIGLEHPGGGI